MRNIWIKHVEKILRGGIILLSILVTIKICFLSLGIDEEYAVTMSYRIAVGDRMFQEMWEPHQTSGFLSAALIRLFLLITGNRAEYLILYLRLCGCFFQLLISLFLYQTTKKYFSSNICFVVSVFFYNTLPKWIQVPEFSNMLIWFSVLAFLCFLRFYFPGGRKTGENCGTGSYLWLIGAGVGVSCLVLSYPSCIFAVPVWLIGMWKVQKCRRAPFSSYFRQIGVFIGTCFGLGISYVIYFASKLSFPGFIYGISQMMKDGSHDITLMAKISNWLQELVGLFPHILIVLVIAGVFFLCIRALGKRGTFMGLVLCAALWEQIAVWLGKEPYLQRPLIYFYILYIWGIIVYFQYFYKKREEKQLSYFLFWMGIIAGGIVWLSAFAITNTSIGVTGSYLMIGLLSAIFLLEDSVWTERSEFPGKLYGLRFLVVSCLLGTTLLAKGYFVCSNEGFKDTVAMVRQKALYGPAKGIYCRYMDGYALNIYAELLQEIPLEQEKVLYVGAHPLVYLYGEQDICNYSTISTPTYDERLWEYWEKNPEKLPEFVIVDVPEEQVKEIRSIIYLGNLVGEKVILEGKSEVKVYEVLRKPMEEMLQND